MGTQGRFSFRSMGQVTGVWPTLTDSTKRKKLASSKNWVLSPCFVPQPVHLPRKKSEVKWGTVSFFPYFSLKPPKRLNFSCFDSPVWRVRGRCWGQGLGARREEEVGRSQAYGRPPYVRWLQTNPLSDVGPDTVARQSSGSSCS